MPLHLPTDPTPHPDRHFLHAEGAIERQSRELGGIRELISLMRELIDRLEDRIDQLERPQGKE
jgi:hypothetical protein